MLKLHVKINYPEGVKFLQHMPEYRQALLQLDELTSHLLLSSPEISENQTTVFRIDSVNSMADIRELLILRNQLASDEQLFNYRVNNGVTRELKIVDAESGSIVLDWRQIPDLQQTDYTNWINANLV